MQKVLPTINPPFNYCPIFDSIMSIIYTDLHLHKSEIINNFIKLHYNLNFKFPITFMEDILCYEMQTLCFSSIPKDIAFLYQDFIELVKSCINNNKYIMLNTDVFYISQYSYYQTYHTPHVLFIYGYDDDKNSFYCADYFDFTHYTHKECTYEEVRHSYSNAAPTYDFVPGMLLINSNNNLKTRDNTEPVFNVNINKIYTDLETTLNATNLKTTNYGNGLLVFQDLINRLDFICKENIPPMLSQNFCFIKVHILLMRYRAIYFNDIMPSNELRGIIVDIDEILKLSDITIVLNIKSNSMFADNLCFHQQYNKMIQNLRIIEFKYRLIIKRFLIYLESL